MSTAPIAQGPVDVNVRPVAWMHDQPERYDVVHNEAKALWLKAWPKQVEHYTIPLYRHERREPLSTDAACALLKDALGIDPLLDGNMLKMLRAVDRAHGIGPNAKVSRSAPLLAQVGSTDGLERIFTTETENDTD